MAKPKAIIVRLIRDGKPVPLEVEIVLEAYGTALAGLSMLVAELKKRLARLERRKRRG